MWMLAGTTTSASTSMVPVTPNMEMDIFRCQGVLILGFVTIKDVAPLDFLMWNYGETYEFITTCLCGSAKCKNPPKNILPMNPTVTFN